MVNRRRVFGLIDFTSNYSTTYLPNRILDEEYSDLPLTNPDSVLVLDPVAVVTAVVPVFAVVVVMVAVLLVVSLSALAELRVFNELVEPLKSSTMSESVWKQKQECP